MISLHPSGDRPQNQADSSKPDFRRRYLPAILLGLVAAISAGHYLLPPAHFLAHNILQRLYYIPIIWAAYSMSQRHATGFALLSAVLYAPHVFLTWDEHPAYLSAQVIEIVLFPVVAMASGWLFARQAAMQQTVLGYARMAQFGAVARSVIRALKSPIRAVQGLIVSLDTMVGHDAGAAEFIKVLKTEVDSIAGVRDNMIRLVERKKLRLASGDLNNLAERFIAHISPSLTENGLGLKMRLATGTLVCHLAEDHILDCLHHLIASMIEGTRRVDHLTVYTGRSERVRWLGVSVSWVYLDSPDYCELATLGSADSSDLAVVTAMNIMNSHFGEVKFRWRKRKLVEFVLVLPKRLKLPWYLKAEAKRDQPEADTAQERLSSNGQRYES